MGDCLAPGDWPVVRGLAVGLTRRQGIRRAVLGHVYGGAAVPVSCGGGVVRLRATHTGFQPTGHHVAAASCATASGSHWWTPEIALQRQLLPAP